MSVLKNVKAAILLGSLLLTGSSSLSVAAPNCNGCGSQENATTLKHQYEEILARNLAYLEKHKGADPVSLVKVNSNIVILKVKIETMRSLSERCGSCG